MNREGKIQRKQSQWHVLWIAPPLQSMPEKCYKALIDSGTAISLLQYSKYQHIADSFKTPIRPTIAKLNTVNSSPMIALGMTALHLTIAGFKFIHNFVICDRLPDTEIISGIDI